MKQPEAQRPEQERIYAELVEAAVQLGLKVRLEQGQFRSERCRRRDENLIILNRRLSPEDRVTVLAGLLAREDLEGCFLRPALRELIASYAQPSATEPEDKGESA